MLKRALIISNSVNKFEVVLQNVVPMLIHLIYADSATLDYVLVNQD